MLTASEIAEFLRLKAQFKSLSFPEEQRYQYLLRELMKHQMQGQTIPLKNIISENTGRAT